MIWLLKGCNKCSGDMYVVFDVDKYLDYIYLKCLMCGNEIELKDMKNEYKGKNIKKNNTGSNVVSYGIKHNTNISC